MFKTNCRAFVEDDVIEGYQAQTYTVMNYYWRPSGNEVDLWLDSAPIAILKENECTVQWSIGRFDSTGKEIYEGDLLRKPDGRTCRVVWFNSPAFVGFDLKVVSGEGCPPSPYSIWDEDWTILDESLE